MPKGKPFPDGEEEERTTIESQWEDEASTTVEEGDVADKIRELGALPRRPQQTGTHTGAGTMDELTVDEAQAQSAITPVRDVARLLITQGNDAGQEIEIRPGKPYTIGRAIDNDVVLTDIAVSRKHFDLRFEDGAWVIVDRGSGNGTVVNGNLEDNPFMLANGDTIEIGNTIFRFDQPNAAPRPQRTMDLDGEEEELSTVAGRPMRGDALPMPDEAIARASTRPPRPKTLPPPTPLRSANASQPPPLGFAPVPGGPVLPSPVPLPPQPGSLQLPQMQGRAPVATPASPTMLADQLAVGSASSLAGPGTPQQQQPRTLYAYPQATEIPPHSVHAQMLLIQTQARRSDGSTALVSPTPYDGVMQPGYLTPQLSKRAKLVLAGIGLAVFAAVLTIAITKSGSEKKQPVASPEPTETETAGGNVATAPAVETPRAPAAAAIETPKAPPPAPSVTAPAPPEPPTTPTPPAPAPTIAKSPPPAPPPTSTAPVAKTTPPAPPPPAPKATKTETPKVTKTETPKPKKTERTERTERREARREPVAAPPPPSTPAPKRVAALDPDQAKDQADSLYRAKKFNEASNVLASAAKKVDEEDARDLRRTSEIYARLGRALAQGTAPATKPTEAFEALRQAATYDRNLGNAFDSEIQSKLAQVAPKAALSYMAAKNYPSARTAVLAAQQFGASESVKLVSQKLESVAGELYNEGMRELDSNPSGAKEKFRQIKSIVDSKSNWYQKAQKQLQGG